MLDLVNRSVLQGLLQLLKRHEKAVLMNDQEVYFLVLNLLVFVQIALL